MKRSQKHRSTNYPWQSLSCIKWKTVKIIFETSFRINPYVTFLFTGAVVIRPYLPRELHFLHRFMAQLQHLLAVQNLLVVQSLPGLPVMSQVCLLSPKTEILLAIVQLLLRQAQLMITRSVKF